MKYVFFHNWYYSSAASGEKMAAEAIEAIRQNTASFPFGEQAYEIASAEAKAGGDHYWLLLFLVSISDPGDDSAAVRNKIEDWLEAIGVSRNTDRTVMTAKADTLRDCVENAYRGAYALHTVIRGGGTGVKAE